MAGKSASFSVGAGIDCSQCQFSIVSKDVDITISVAAVDCTQGQLTILGKPAYVVAHVYTTGHVTIEAQALSISVGVGFGCTQKQVAIESKAATISVGTGITCTQSQLYSAGALTLTISTYNYTTGYVAIAGKSPEVLAGTQIQDTGGTPIEDTGGTPVEDTGG